MDLINYDLYKDLITSRTSREKTIDAEKNELLEVSNRLKNVEEFVASFDATQTSLQDSIDKLKQSITDNERNLDSFENDNSIANKALDEEKDSLNEEQSKLKAMEDKLASQEVKDPELQAEVVKQKALVATKQAKLNELQNNVYLLETKIKDTKNTLKADGDSKSNSETQIAEDQDRKKEKDSSGEIDQLKADKTKVEASLADSESELSDFNDKNKSTIDSYEKQENTRSRNILKRPIENLYNRAPENSESLSRTIAVTRGVIDGIMNDNATDPEKEMRKVAIEAGADREFNPDMMTAEEAKDYTLKSIWTTKQIAEQIKEACENGKYELRLPSLSDNIIFTLQYHGYKVSLENMSANFAKDQDILISWGTIPASEEEKS